MTISGREKLKIKVIKNIGYRGCFFGFIFEKIRAHFEV